MQKGGLRLIKGEIQQCHSLFSSGEVQSDVGSEDETLVCILDGSCSVTVFKKRNVIGVMALTLN